MIDYMAATTTVQYRQESLLADGRRLAAGRDARRLRTDRRASRPWRQLVHRLTPTKSRPQANTAPVPSGAR